MSSAAQNRPGKLRRLVSSVTSHQDPEQGYPPTVPGDDKEAPIERRLTVITNQRDALVPPEDKLLIFRTLTGIDTVPIVSRFGHAARTAPNIGIYTRVVRHERSAKRMHRIIKAFASLCLGLQIIMGAAVTALGAAKGSYNSITGLGAVSTVTASIVAYVKGTGQPQKLKYVENRWRWIREHIEQRERELCLADCSLDVYREVRIVEEMYSAVAMELDADKSDRNTSQGQNKNGDDQGQRGLGPGGFGGSSFEPRRRSEAMSFDGRDAHHNSAPGHGDSAGGGNGSVGMTGMTAVDLSRRSEVMSYDGREAPQRSTARPDSTATFSSPYEKGAADAGPASGDKPPHE
ncbi:hypothetical protein ACO1O0_005047 [Amphichorda felina]